jgi:hypothetical protein
MAENGRKVIIKKVNLPEYSGPTIHEKYLCVTVKNVVALDLGSVWAVRSFSSYKLSHFVGCDFSLYNAPKLHFLPCLPHPNSIGAT